MNYESMKVDGNLSNRLTQDLQRRRRLLMRLSENEGRSPPVSRHQRRHRTSLSDPAVETNSYGEEGHGIHNQLTASLQYLPANAILSASLPSTAFTSSHPSIYPMSQPSRDSGQHMKTEIIDMMMMQNTQLHQLMTQQMTISYLTPESSPSSVRMRKKHRSDNLDDLLLQHLKRKDLSDDDDHRLPPYWLPPMPLPTFLYYQSQPLKPPIDWRRNRSKAPRPRPLYKPKSIAKKNTTQRSKEPLKWFRRAALAVIFAVALERRRKRAGPRRVPQLNEKFLFGIRLRESIAAMHNIWLKPEKRISKILRRVLDDKARDYTVILRSNADKEELSDVYQELAVILENTIYEMTEIMPTRGVLGTNRKSTVYRMIQPRQSYPKGYFWQIEKDLMKINFMESLDRILDSDASVLLVGLFLGRGIISSLVLRPKEFHVTTRSSKELSRRSERNLCILASLFLFILRRFYGSTKTLKTILPIPDEYKEIVHGDEQLRSAVKALNKSIDYGQQLLTDWSMEYTKRLRSVL